MTEQLLQQTLDQTTNFLERQRLFKELWKLYRYREAEAETETSRPIESDCNPRVAIAPPQSPGR